MALSGFSGFTTLKNRFGKGLHRFACNEENIGDESKDLRKHNGFLSSLKDESRKIFSLCTLDKQKAAFTLAEVLITLGIIGVVAAMTMPTLINKYQKQETVTRLAEAYSLILQAIKRAEVDYESVQYWDFDLESQEFNDKYIKPYFQVIEEYGSGEMPVDIYYLNGELGNGGFGYKSLPKFVIKNGTSIAVRTEATAAGVRYLTYIVDLNGFKKPNTLGKDIFAFSTSAEGKLVPYGVAEVNGGTADKIGYNRNELLNGSDGRACNKNGGTSAGAFCAAIIVMDGWKIADDYPW